MTTYTDPNTYWMLPLGRAVVGSPQGIRIVGDSSNPTIITETDGNNFDIVPGGNSGTTVISWNDTVNNGTFTLVVSAAQDPTYLSLSTHSPQGVRVVGD